MTIARKRWWLLVPAWALALGCGGGGEPVATLSVEPSRLELGYPGFAELTFDWSFDASREWGEGEPRVFVHLLDETGRMVRTFDHALPVAWQEGTQASYRATIYQSALAPQLTAGSYRLTAGLYDLSGRRWPLTVDGEEVEDQAYRVATVDVVESSDEAPMFFFSPAWQPVEGGTDRQVLGRRWLADAGFLRLSEIRSPGRLWLLLGVPSGQSKVEDLVLDEGASIPAVTVTTDCGDLEANITGSGSHELAVPVAAGDDGVLPAECEVRFDTNYSLVSLETLAKRTVALENLAWAAD